MSVRPAKTQISLGIRPVWSESSLCTQWVAKDPSFLHADSEDSDQTGRMPRLIWVFAGRTATLLVLSCRGSYWYYCTCICKLCQWGKGTPLSKQIVKLLVKIEKNSFLRRYDKSQAFWIVLFSGKYHFWFSRYQASDRTFWTILVLLFSRAYHNFPRFSDRQVWANSADPDQTATRGAFWSGSTLFAIPSASFGCITLRKRHLVQLLGW